MPPQREGFLPRGILRISRDRDDRMGLKTKPEKIRWAFNKIQKKSLDQKLTPQKSHAEFLSLKNLQKGKQVCRLNFNHRTRRPGFVGTIRNLQIDFLSQKFLLKSSRPKKYLPNLTTTKNPTSNVCVCVFFFFWRGGGGGALVLV